MADTLPASPEPEPETASAMPAPADPPPPPQQPPEPQPRPRDLLGLKADREARLLPWMIGVMGCLAALALVGAVAVAVLAARWEQGTAGAVSVQVPDPDRPAATGGNDSRLAAALAVLRTTPGVAAAVAVDRARMAELLAPWLGTEAGAVALPLPGLIDVRLGPRQPEPAELRQRLARVAPGSTVETHGLFVGALLDFARSLTSLARIVALGVAVLWVAMVAFAVRASIAAHRGDIAILHDLGASDCWIVRRFARRFGWLGFLGGAVAVVLAAPALLALSARARPLFMAAVPAVETAEAAALDALGGLLSGASLPAEAWALLASLPPVAAVLAAATAAATALLWLRRLP